MTKILSFDASSTTIGYAILEIDGLNNIKFISCDHLKPIKSGTIIERLADTRDKIQKIINNIQPDLIGIEEIVQFMAGKSTAKTIITLTAFNRMIGLLAYDYLKTNPKYLSVMTIRHALKLNKIFPKKEEIPSLVEKHLNITFPSVLGKKGKIKPETYDRADAVAVGLTYAFQLTNKLKKK